MAALIPHSRLDVQISVTSAVRSFHFRYSSHNSQTDEAVVHEQTKNTQCLGINSNAQCFMSWTNEGRCRDEECCQSEGRQRVGVQGMVSAGEEGGGRDVESGACRVSAGEGDLWVWMCDVGHDGGLFLPSTTPR